MKILANAQTSSDSPHAATAPFKKCEIVKVYKYRSMKAEANACKTCLDSPHSPAAPYIEQEHVKV